MVTSPPFDPNVPPVEPPEGCPRPMVWRLARGLWQAHQPAVDGFCQQCGRANRLYPCPPSRLALQGLAYACGVPAEAGGWAEYLRRRHRQTGRW
ncbi:hypothetical protein ACNTMW_29275 [Planosporangium sp. 12N6]|uniref:hypothetical protein n=1 Tax=Planosporangium spinosum TaxID=3402278 RepID=UPI003CF8BE4A